MERLSTANRIYRKGYGKGEARLRIGMSCLSSHLPLVERVVTDSPLYTELEVHNILPRERVNMSCHGLGDDQRVRSFILPLCHPSSSSSFRKGDKHKQLQSYPASRDTDPQGSRRTRGGKVSKIDRHDDAFMAVSIRVQLYRFVGKKRVRTGKRQEL